MVVTYYQGIAQERTASHDGRRKDENLAPTFKAELIGTIAEGEFAKAFDLSFQGNAGVMGDDGYDFTLPDGRTLDIKGTDRQNGNLLVHFNKDKSVNADVFVLAIVDLEKETADFIGWTTRNVVTSASIKDWGYAFGAAYFVSRNLLRPMKELF